MPELRLDITKAWIPVSAAITIGVTLFGAWNNWRDLNDRVLSLEAKSLLIREPIAEGNRWTCLDHERWLTQLQRMNPKLAVPSIPKVCTP